MTPKKNRPSGARNRRTGNAAMSGPTGMTRRGFLGTAAAGVGTVAFGLGAGAGVAKAQETGSTECFRLNPVFSDHEFDTMQALAAQIIPTDEDAGAEEMCLTSLIELDPETAAAFKGIVAAIDASSMLLYGSNFKDLPEYPNPVNPEDPNQMMFLQMLQYGQLPVEIWGPLDNPDLAKKWAKQMGGLGGHVISEFARVKKGEPVFGPIEAESFPSQAQINQMTCFITIQMTFVMMWVSNLNATLPPEMGFEVTTELTPEMVQTYPPLLMPVFMENGDLGLGSAHLISDPDFPVTGSAWDILKIHVPDWGNEEYEYIGTEQLMWIWQAGIVMDPNYNAEVDGLPQIDEEATEQLTYEDRIAARDELFRRSKEGLA